jgi:L-alanine-DL-glutamate epimerase-like enolase superfamily enzyme
VTADPIVERVDARVLRVPLPQPMRPFGYEAITVCFVSVVADGVEGTGFAYTLDAGIGITAAMVEEVVGPAFAGRRLSRWAATGAEVLALTRRLSSTAYTAAVSAVDIAVWDLRARLADSPLWRLLGGVPDPVPFYGSGRGGHLMPVARLADLNAAYLEEGFAAVKIGVGAVPPAEDVARVAALRSAVGEAATIMVDGSERLGIADALDLGRRLDPFGLAWFEEPLPAEDVDGYRLLAERLTTPLATGEHFQQLATQAHYLRATDVAYYQPDAALGGGVTGALRMAALVTAQSRRIAWHSLADLHIHLAAATPGSDWVEDFPILDAVIEDPLRPVAGTALPPDRAGHGIRWDRAALDHYTVSGRSPARDERKTA